MTGGSDVVYRYAIGSLGCHYHGFSRFMSSKNSVIESSMSVVFVFEYLLSASADLSTGNNTVLAAFESVDVNGTNGCAAGKTPVRCLVADASRLDPRGVWRTVSLSSKVINVAGIILFFYSPVGAERD